MSNITSSGGRFSDWLTSWGRRYSDWLRDGFVLSKTVLFIWGLVLSNVGVKRAVVQPLMDFFTDERDHNLWEAAMLVNLLGGLSAVFKIAVTHVSEAYTRRFTVVIFGTAAFTMGLMLLWVCASPTFLDHGVVIFAIVLLALGRTGAHPALKDFFNHQLSEKVKENRIENNREDGESLEENEKRSRTWNLWSCTASLIGAAIAILWLGKIPWPTRFKGSSLVMAAMYLLFFSGIFCYYPEGRPTGSPLTTIYRVFKTAIKKRRLPCPTSKEDYYSINNNQGSNDSEGAFYPRKNGEVHLLPRAPSFLFLDKAAVIMNKSDPEGEQRNGELCTVDQVRDVKGLYPLIPLGFTFFAYSLVSASGNTYFVKQTSNLDTHVGNFQAPVIVFFVKRSSFGSMARILSREKLNPIWKMGVGLLCSTICCIVAWQVEHRRLFLVRKYPDEETIPLNIMILAPQYILLGLMKGFAEGGLKIFVHKRVPASMRDFADSCIEMLLAIGNFTSILFAIIFRFWIKDSINNSHLDRYFLMLASLSFVFFCFYVCYAIFKLSKPQNEEPRSSEKSESEENEEPRSSERSESEDEIQISTE